MSDVTRFAVAVHAIIERDGYFLVVRRAASERYCPGLWDLPGGGVQPGETAVEALHREVAEETGLVVADVMAYATHTNLSQLPGRQTVQIVYRCHMSDGMLRLEPSEHDAFEWLPWGTDLGALAGGLMPYLAALAGRG